MTNPLVAVGTTVVGITAEAAHRTRKRVVATWSNYYNTENLRQFTTNTAIAVKLRVFGSNGEMKTYLMAYLLKGRADLLARFK